MFTGNKKGKGKLGGVLIIVGIALVLIFSVYAVTATGLFKEADAPNPEDLPVENIHGRISIEGRLVIGSDIRFIENTLSLNTNVPYQLTPFCLITAAKDVTCQVTLKDGSVPVKTKIAKLGDICPVWDDKPWFKFDFFKIPIGRYTLDMECAGSDSEDIDTFSTEIVLLENEVTF